MSGRSVESTSTARTFSPCQPMCGVSSNEKGVYPPLYSPSFSPLIQTVEAVITPSKSTKTRLPWASLGKRKRRRYKDTNSYSFSSKPCQGRRTLVCGTTTRSRLESSKSFSCPRSKGLELKRQLRLMGSTRRPAALFAIGDSASACEASFAPAMSVPVVRIKLRLSITASFRHQAFVLKYDCVVQMNYTIQESSCFMSVDLLDTVPRGTVGPITTAELCSSNQARNADTSAPGSRC